MQITNIDRPTHRLIATAIVAALASVAKEYGVEIKDAGGTFGIDGGTACVVKLSVRTANVEAQTTASRAEWDRYAELFGLRSDVFGMSFTHKGKTHTVTGIDARRRTRPVKTTCLGKGYVWPVDAIRTLTKTGAPDRKPFATINADVSE